MLVRELRIVDRREAELVSIPEHSPELLAGDRCPSRYDQSCVTKIDETDLAAMLDTPPPAQLCREAGLPSMGDSCVRRGVHWRIVQRCGLQGVGETRSE